MEKPVDKEKLMQFYQYLSVFRRYTYLRLALLLAVLLIAGMPLIGHFAIFPLFEQTLIKSTEHEAIRIGNFLISHMELDRSSLSSKNLPSDMEHHAKDAIVNLELAKLKLFDKDGITIYSSDPKDIGKLNQHNYFHEQVARGLPFTKTVRKDKPSLEGQFYTVDVVETYVPVILKNKQFGGAFELYFDITSDLAHIRQLTNYITLISVMGGMLLLIVIFNLLLRAGKSFDQLMEIDQQLTTINHQKEMILDTAEEGIFGVDQNGSLTFANRAALDMLGYPLEKLLNTNHHDLIHHTKADSTPNPLEDCIVRKSFEKRKVMNSNKELFWRADGNSFPIDISVAPLIEDDKVIGAVAAFHDISKQLADEQALLEANEKLDKLSRVDALTEVPNRRAFDHTLSRVWREHERSEQPLSMLMIDIDFFKRYNDRYGHQAGDVCLKQVASALSKCIYRPSDFLARYGGEEFVMLLDETDAPGAELVAKRACNSIESLHLTNEGSEISDWVTISIGVASLTSLKDQASEQLLKQADQALYDAKEQGRNRYTISAV